MADKQINPKIENIKVLEPLSKFEPLNRTERMILDSMQDAIALGNVEKIQNTLATLAENPQSVNRVLDAVRTQMKKENWQNAVGWEQGIDSSGHSFIWLNLEHFDELAKTSGYTRLTIGSDGQNWDTHYRCLEQPCRTIVNGLLIM